LFSKKCKLHLEEVGETPLQHFKHAMWVFLQLQKASIAVVIHAIAPRFFVSYASDKCKQILESRKK